MNKREMIHALIDRLLDVEESSKKKVFINYSGHIKNLSFYITPSHDFSIWLEDKRFELPLDWGHLQENYECLLSDIERLTLITDESIEEVVSIRMKKSEAKAKGLIA